jgi:hypothetical protein
VSGGKLPVNVMTITTFLFPLCGCIGLVLAGRASPPEVAQQIA